MSIYTRFFIALILIGSMLGISTTPSSALTTTVSASSFNTLHRGDEGKRVKLVQKVLGVFPITGRYKHSTYIAVKHFQRARGLPKTGKVDYLTMRKILSRWDNMKIRREAAYDKIMTIARNQIGSPYVFGAAGPYAFDCSGLTMFVYNRAANISLPHHAGYQSQRGTRIPRHLARPGDLVFFQDGGYVYHAAIYAGNGNVIEASNPSRPIGRHALWSNNIFFERMFKIYIPKPA